MERTIQNRPGKTFSLIKTEIKKKRKTKGRVRRLYSIKSRHCWVAGLSD